MQVVDSKKKILTFPEILGHAIAAASKDKQAFQKSLMMALEEIKMPSAEAINIKNTLFLGHFTPDRKTALLKVFNADTFKNFLGNLEIYLRDALQHGTDLFVYPYENHSAESVFNHLRKRNITIETRSSKDGKMVAVIMLDANLVKGKTEKPAKKPSKKW